MTRKTAMSGLLIFVFVFIGATVIPAGYAQQSSDLGNTAGSQSRGATSTAKANREKSVQAGVGEAWQAGQAEMSTTAKWGAEQQGFAPARSTAWTAGAASFGAAKQPGGIWSESHRSATAEAGSKDPGEPKMPALLITPAPLITPGPDLMASPSGLPRTRAASLGKSRFQPSPGGKTGKSGSSAFAAGGPRNPFGSGTQSTSRIGTGSKLGSARQTLSAGSPLDSSLKDSFVSDDGPAPVTPQDADPLSH